MTLKGDIAGTLGHALVDPYVPEAVLAITAFPLMLAWLTSIARDRELISYPA